MTLIFLPATSISVTRSCYRLEKKQTMLRLEIVYLQHWGIRLGCQMSQPSGSQYLWLYFAIGILLTIVVLLI